MSTFACIRMKYLIQTGNVNTVQFGGHTLFNFWLQAKEHWFLKNPWSGHLRACYWLIWQASCEVRSCPAIKPLGLAMQNNKHCTAYSGSPVTSRLPHPLPTVSKTFKTAFVSSFLTAALQAPKFLNRNKINCATQNKEGKCDELGEGKCEIWEALGPRSWGA